MALFSVPIAKFAKDSGRTEKAVRRKIESGVWLDGFEINRSANGELSVFLPGYERWAQGLPRIPAAELLNSLLNANPA